jgi:hypothetical protein
MGVRGELFSARVKSKNDRRTYFFNVKENRNNDVFVTVVESKKAGEGESFDRHQVVVFEEDLQLFRKGIDTVLEYLESRQGGRRRDGGGHGRSGGGGGRSHDGRERRERDGSGRDGRSRDGGAGERKPTRLRRRTPDEVQPKEQAPESPPADESSDDT